MRRSILRVHAQGRSTATSSAQTATRLAVHVRAFTPNPSASQAETSVYGGQVYFLGLRGFYWKPGSLALLLEGFPGCGCGARRAAHHGDATGAVSSWSPSERSRWLRPYFRPGGVGVELRGPDDRLLAWVYDWPGAP